MTGITAATFRITPLTHPSPFKSISCYLSAVESGAPSISIHTPTCASHRQEVSGELPFGSASQRPSRWFIAQASSRVLYRKAGEHGWVCKGVNYELCFSQTHWSQNTLVPFPSGQINLTFLRQRIQWWESPLLQITSTASKLVQFHFFFLEQLSNGSQHMTFLTHRTVVSHVAGSLNPCSSLPKNVWMGCG